MTNKILIVLSLLCSALLFPQNDNAENKLKILFLADAGAVNENFSWNIAGNLNGTSPNVFSELTWKNLKGIIYSSEVDIRYKKIGVSFSYSKANFHEGQAFDTDYNEDDKQDMAFYAKLSGKNSNSNQFNANLCYTIFENNSISVTSAIGYTEINQNYKLKDPEYTILNSSYAPKWHGLSLGIKTEYNRGRLTIAPSFTYMQLDYIAKADWNLIEAFKHPLSFKHTANGFGLNADIKLKWQLFTSTNLYVRYLYNYLTTGKGIEYLYLSDDRVLKTRLNDATGSSQSLLFGIVYVFR